MRTQEQKAQIKEMHNEIASALLSIGARYGFGTVKTGMRYDDLGFSLSVKAQWVGGAQGDGAKREWEISAPLLDIPADAFGKVIRMGERRYRLTGINLRAPKWPVHALNLSDGKNYRLKAEGVRIALQRAEQEGVSQ